MSNLPPKYWKYQQQPGVFITYYGTIHVGVIFLAVDSNSIFIVPNINLKNANESQKTALELRELGIEIPSFEIVVRVYDKIDLQDRVLPPTVFSADCNVKKLFIFGAGASSFCIGLEHEKSFREDHLCPPLGVDLFDNRFQMFIAKYRGVNALIPAFELAQKNIEKTFQKEWEKIVRRKDVDRLNKLISCQYYLQELFIEVSNRVKSMHTRENAHAQLFHHLLESVNDNEQIGIVSFNYDTLVEDSISRVTFEEFSSINSYASFSSKFCLFKPHGSCNWGWKFTGGEYFQLYSNEIADKIVKEKVLLADIYFHHIDKLFSVVSKHSYGFEAKVARNGIGFYSINKERIEVFSKNKGYFPALLVPFSLKDEFLMPYSHDTKLDIMLEKVEEIVCIGWKGNEELFNSRLKSKIKLSNFKRLTIVDPKSETVADNLKNYVDLNQVEVDFHESFIQYVRSLTQ